MIFVDNFAAQDCLIKGASTDLDWREILMILERVDDRLMTSTWIARVPSASNVADPPSRGDVSEIKFLEPMDIVGAVCPVTKEPLKDLLQ